MHGSRSAGGYYEQIDEHLSMMCVLDPESGTGLRCKARVIVNDRHDAYVCQLQLDQAAGPSCYEQACVPVKPLNAPCIIIGFLSMYMAICILHLRVEGLRDYYTTSNSDETACISVQCLHCTRGVRDKKRSV